MALLNFVLVSIVALLHFMATPADAQFCSDIVTDPVDCGPSGTQRTALLAMMTIIGGPIYWVESNNGVWEGLGCASGSPDIVCISLFGAFSGDFSAVDLSDLTSLKLLVLPSNTLTGTLPTSISALTNLEYLDLSLTGLTGTLHILEPLTSLKYLYLQDNSFNGTIPYRFACFKSLVELYLSNNQLTGKLPSNLKLPNVESIDFSTNLLWGSIPSDLVSYYNDRVKPLSLGLSANYLKSSFVVPSPASFDSGVTKTFGQNCFTSADNQRTTPVCDAFYLDKSLSDVPEPLPSCPGDRIP